MDHETYANEAVVRLIQAHYVPLRIDQDARPDLANRYREYGWPATVVFAPDGTEIVKRRGYIPAQRFERLLKAIVVDPSPEAVAATDASAPTATGTLAAAVRNTLQERHRSTHDTVKGGLAIEQKFLDRDSVELQLQHALGAQRDADEAGRARQTLDAAGALMDPVWGGVYQYSTHGDWHHPHFEKLATLQAEYLRIYALAWASFRRDSDRAAVTAIRRYIDTFLRSPDGGYYTSQDADLKPGEHAEDYFALDDQSRRSRGIPRVDPHRYAQQSGLIAEALATWSEFSGDTGAREQAEAAARWVLRERQLPGGGFRHDSVDAAGPYLADTLAMGRAFLALYRASGDRIWLRHANAAGDFIIARFRDNAAGFASSAGSGPIAAVAQIDENISAVRFLNLLSRYTGSRSQREASAHGLNWLGRPGVALQRASEAGILLADREYSSEPVHLTVIGSRDDDAAKELFVTTQQLANWYKRNEWLDRSGEPLLNPDVDYPPTKRAAAFVCTDSRCSLPIYSSGDIAQFLNDETAQDDAQAGPVNPAATPG